VTKLRSLAARSAPTVLLLGVLAISACRTTPEKDSGGEFSDSPPAAPAPAASAVELEAVYFDFDSAVLRDDARATLKKNAEELRASSAVVTLEGHTDERGTEEYNLALGERRGESVRKYLVDLGIPASRLRVVSFGEAKPAVMGHDESAWKWNRRVEAQ
jgi:peptidoglycan-associated lipoprotein